jgi:hypothetical protein
MVNPLAARTLTGSSSGDIEHRLDAAQAAVVIVALASGPGSDGHQTPAPDHL